MENLSAVLYGKKDLRMEHQPIKPPGIGEVQVAVRNSGLCMTDVHVHDEGRVGDIIVTSPVVIGHEFSGVINDVGPDVTNVKPGDRVTVDSLISCGKCRLCKLGRSNMCVLHAYIGFPSHHGGLTRLATVPACNAHVLPDDLSFKEAALMEPLSVCVNAVKRCDVTMGDNVVVLGAGPIGLMTSQVARAQGAFVVCITDIHEERLELARSLGTTHAVKFSENETDAQANAKKLRDAVGADIDVVLECSGVPVCLQTAIYAVRSGGVVGVVGFGPHDVTIPIVDAAIREVDIRGCVCNNYCFPTAIKLVSSGQVKLQPIISHRLPLADLPRALDLVRSRQVVKVIIDCFAESK